MTKSKFDVDTGRVELSDAKVAFLEWHLMPASLRVEEGMPVTQLAYAASIGVNPNTLGNWKKEPIWQRALEARLAELNVGGDRLQAIIDNLYAIAIDRDHKNVVQASTLYLQYVEKLKPTRVLVESQKGTPDLSDEDLAAELAAEAYTLRSVK